MKWFPHWFPWWSLTSYEVKCNKVTVFNFWFHLPDLEVLYSATALFIPANTLYCSLNYIGKISGWNWKFFRPPSAQDIIEERIIFTTYGKNANLSTWPSFPFMWNPRSPLLVAVAASENAYVLNPRSWPEWNRRHLVNSTAPRWQNGVKWVLNLSISRYAAGVVGPGFQLTVALLPEQKNTYLCLEVFFLWHDGSTRATMREIAHLATYHHFFLFINYILLSPIYLAEYRKIPKISPSMYKPPKSITQKPSVKSPLQI